MGVSIQGVREEVRKACPVSAGIKWALVLLVILNLLQLNLLYFSSSGSTRCILKAALAMRARARSGEAAPPPAAPVLPGSPLGSFEQLGKPVVGTHLPMFCGQRHMIACSKADTHLLPTALTSVLHGPTELGTQTTMGHHMLALLYDAAVPRRQRGFRGQGAGATRYSSSTPGTTKCS